MRVIRKLDDADELIQSFPAWEISALPQDSHTASSSHTLPDSDQRRLLDFPDPDAQAANIARSSPLSKQALLARAAETPAQLSAAEVALLKDRYWLNITPDEAHAVSRATGLLSGPRRVSAAEHAQATERLRAVRCSFYAADEEKAIDNAVAEHWRRESEAWRARQRQEVERALGNAFPWVRRLWEEDKGQKNWGYSIFVDPEVFGDEEPEAEEEYMCRRDGVLFHARGAIGAASAVSNMWKLQRLEWPASAMADEEEENMGGHAVQKGCVEDDSDTAPDAVGREKEGTDEEETDEVRAARFQKLRERFKSIRDRVPGSQRQEYATSSALAQQSDHGGLRDGILQNVFLVDDKYSTGSVLSRGGLVDDMWVWAVDPDYLEDDADEDSAAAATTTTGTSIEGSTLTGECPRESSVYKGFMRVRLQQLVNNFYDARRFHQDEYPVRKLWEAAQKSKHQAFVSLKDEDARSWSVDRFVGSAMRAQPPRVVYGPKPVVPAGRGA